MCEKALPIKHTYTNLQKRQRLGIRHAINLSTENMSIHFSIENTCNMSIYWWIQCVGYATMFIFTKQTTPLTIIHETWTNKWPRTILTKFSPVHFSTVRNLAENHFKHTGFSHDMHMQRVVLNLFPYIDPLPHLSSKRLLKHCGKKRNCLQWASRVLLLS